MTEPLDNKADEQELARLVKKYTRKRIRARVTDIPLRERGRPKGKRPSFLKVDPKVRKDEWEFYRRVEDYETAYYEKTGNMLRTDTAIKRIKAIDPTLPSLGSLKDYYLRGRRTAAIIAMKWFEAQPSYDPHSGEPMPAWLAKLLEEK